MAWEGRPAHPTGSPSCALPHLSLSSTGSWPSSHCHSVPPALGTWGQGLGWGVGSKPKFWPPKGGRLGSHPAVLARAPWQSGISSSLYPTPEVSHSGAHFHLCQTRWALLSPPNPLALPTWDWSHLRGPQCHPPAQGPALGGRWAAGKHSWDLGSSEPALRGGGRGLLDTPAGAGATCGVCPQPAPSSPLSS